MKPKPDPVYLLTLLRYDQLCADNFSSSHAVAVYSSFADACGVACRLAGVPSESLSRFPAFGEACTSRVTVDGETFRYVVSRLTLYF